MIPAVKSSANRVVNDPGEVKLHETLHKRCDLLVKVTAKVRQALDGDNHPDLLSPQRSRVRPLGGLRELGMYFNIHSASVRYNSHDKVNPSVPQATCRILDGNLSVQKTFDLVLQKFQFYQIGKCFINHSKCIRYFRNLCMCINGLI